MQRYFIPFNTPSSKNSRVWTGKFFIPSKLTTQYVKNTNHIYAKYALCFRDECEDLNKAYKVHFYFIRDSRRKFDLINAAQIVQDMMVKHNWIDDDNMTEITPVFDGYEVNKERVGVLIWVDNA